MCDVALQDSGHVDAIVSGDWVDSVGSEVGVGTLESGQESKMGASEHGTVD